MKILLAGDSKRFPDIIRSLLGKKHRITVINADMAYCRQLADQYEEITVFHGDSTNSALLKDIHTPKFDMVIAMSRYDSENLIICELCREILHVQTTAALISFTQNSDIFRRLGVTTVIDTNEFIISSIQ